MTKREFLDTVFALAPNEANAIMDAFDEYVESNEPHWIPVTERPPDEDVDVLCETFVGTRLVASYGFLNPWNKEKGWITAEFNRLPKEMVKAWMPLPEPYKGVTE